MEALPTEEVLLLIDGDNFICGAEDKRRKMQRRLNLNPENIKIFIEFLQHQIGKKFTKKYFINSLEKDQRTGEYLYQTAKG